MNRLVPIGEAASALGVSVFTLRRWEKSGRLVADERTRGGQRRYDITRLLPSVPHQSALPGVTIAYARVSSHDQRNDLERQKMVLEAFCAANGWEFEVVADLGSGMNYNKKGLRRFLDRVLAGEVRRLVITHKDRLLRFGAELVFAICEAKGVDVVIVNKGEDSSFEEDLAKDVLEIITVFSAKLYGARSRQNKKLLDKLREAVESSTESALA